MLCAQSSGDAGQRLGCAGAIRELQEGVHVVRTASRGCRTALGVCWGHSGVAGGRACRARSLQVIAGNIGVCWAMQGLQDSVHVVRAISRGCRGAFGCAGPQHSIVCIVCRVCRRVCTVSRGCVRSLQGMQSSVWGTPPVCWGGGCHDGRNSMVVRLKRTCTLLHGLPRHM
jgi:hypothetical protein